VTFELGENLGGKSCRDLGGVFSGTVFALSLGMSRTNQLTRYTGRRIARRMTRSIPFIGAFIAVATIGSAIRRKGLVRGVLHSGLDAIPFVGGAKTLAEAARGRDFLRDKPEG
jgi:hypothetical protein